MSYRPEGDLATAQYIIIGEAPGADEIARGRPFVGPSGHIFDQALQGAGINRSDCYIDNVFPGQVSKDIRKKSTAWTLNGVPVWRPTKNDFTEDGLPHRNALLSRVASTPENSVIIALGGVALRALTGLSPISTWRGSFISAQNLPTKPPLVATYHPVTVLYGETLNRWYILNDFRRAARAAAVAPNIITPDWNFINNPTFNTCLHSLEQLLSNNEPMSVDIEVAACQTSMISFGWGNGTAISIPYGEGNWTEEQEIILWNTTSTLLQSNKPKVFHNAAFDVQFLWQIHHVMVAPPIHDTMVLYAVMYPEFKKRLGMLATLYTDQPYWKHLVKMGAIYKEED